MSNRRTDRDLLLPYGDVLQVKNGAIWETKFVVVSPNDRDPSRILIAFFDDESGWKEGYIGDLAFGCPDCVVKEITLYSTVRGATKDERAFRGRSRGFVLAVSNAIDPDDVDTVLFNALDEDQKKYWLNMFRLCFLRLRFSKDDSVESQKDKSGWMPALTMDSVQKASKDPIMKQYETLQRDGRWIENNLRTSSDRSKSKKNFQYVPEHLRHYFFHIGYGTQKILNMRRSLLRFLRFFIHMIMFLTLILYIVDITSTIQNRREMAQSLKEEIDTPFYYNSNELKMIGFSNVSSVDDFLGWMENTIITHGYFFQTDTNQRLNNIMLGSMRIRQVRRETKSSSLSSNTTGVDLTTYSLNRLRDSASITCATDATYCPSSGSYDWYSAAQTEAPPNYRHFVRKQHERFITPPYSGYVVDLDSSNYTYALEQISSLRDSQFFLVPHTAMIYVTASFFNPNIDVMWQTEMSFEVTAGGKIYPSLYFSLTHGSCINGTASTFTFVVLMSMVSINILFLLQETRILTRSCQKMLGLYVSHLRKKIILMWYFLDVCVSLLVIVCVSLTYSECNLVDSFSQSVSFDSNQYVDLKESLDYTNLSRSILTLASFAMLFLIFRHIREWRSISSVALVLRESKSELLGFVVVFLTALISFSLAMRSLLGPEHFEFSDIKNSLRTFVFFYGVFLDSEDFLVIDTSSYDIYIVLNIVLCLVLISQVILAWLVISIFIERFYSVRKTIRRQTAMAKRSWFEWENSDLIKVYAARRVLDYVQMAILFPSFYKHIVEAILTNEDYRERLYLTYEELHQIVRNELEHNRHCCGCRCRFNVFEIFMNKDQDADSIVRTIIALQPTNLKCVPSVLRYWALRKEEDENEEENNFASRRSGMDSSKHKEEDDYDDRNEKNGKLGLWTNASKLGLGDVTSKQQIATQWNTRTMRAELIHASVYILRKRSRERFTKLNQCVRELQRTQRMVEDLVHDLSERVEMLTNTKIDIFAEEEEEFDKEDRSEDDNDSDRDQDSSHGDDNDDKNGADDEKNADGNSKIGSSRYAKKNEKVGDVALNIDPKHVEDSKADSTGPAAAAKSSDSKDKEQHDNEEDEDESEGKDKIGLAQTGVVATRKALEGLTSKVFKRNVDKKDKFKESARAIQQFQDELNSTVAELQAERIVRDEHEKNSDDTDEEKDDDDDDHGDDDEHIDQNDPKSNGTSSSKETQKWKEFGFTREFMKRWQTINRNNPIDQSWDTLNSNLQKNAHHHEGQDGAGDTESQNNKKNDENNKKDSTGSKSSTGSTGVGNGRSGSTLREGNVSSGWRKWVPFASNRTTDGTQVDEDEYDESDEETLPDLLSLDQINELWEKKDDEWREYLALNRPESLIKKRIQVEWEDGFESGVITQFNRHTRKHTVQYDDGELRKYDLRRKNYRFVIG